jgi:hypothetical protein
VSKVISAKFSENEFRASNLSDWSQSSPKQLTFQYSSSSITGLGAALGFAFLPFFLTSSFRLVSYYFFSSAFFTLLASFFLAFCSS